MYDARVLFSATDSLVCLMVIMGGGGRERKKTILMNSDLRKNLLRMRGVYGL